MRMRFKPYAHDELMAADFHVHEPLIWGGKWHSQLFLMVQKGNFQNTYHFFIFGIKFPRPFFDNHFIVIIEPFQHGCIIFFIRPFESLIGRCFS